MLRSAAASILLVALASAGCAGGGASPAQQGGASAPTGRPLAGLAAQRIIVAPVAVIAEGDSLGWAAGIPRQREWLRQLDQEIATELGARGLEGAWVFPEALAKGFQRNPTLSPDPYRLAVDPLRNVTRPSPELRAPDPLASQLRTLVAVHDGRFVLLPVQVGFEPAGAAGGRGVLRLLLVDARTTEVRWAGDVRSDVFPTFEPGVAVSLAARLADLIAAR